jgi:hypothetical protein
MGRIAILAATLALVAFLAESLVVVAEIAAARFQASRLARQAKARLTRPSERPSERRYGFSMLARSGQR